MAAASPDEPEWGLLPDRPREFFGLDESFDTRELKRAYNRFLRRFKPEQHPEEFQRIRRAYELLKDGLSFGSVAPATSFTSREEIDALVTPQAVPFEEARLDLHAAIEGRSLTELQAELEAIPAKTPREWLLLALVSDELAPEEPLCLHDILIRAQIELGGSHELWSFMFPLCREPLDAKSSLRLVQRLVKATEAGVLAPDSYYFLTVTSWETLFDSADFDRVASVLGQCRERVGEEGFTGYIVLLVRLVRVSAYRAAPDWLDDALDTINEVYSRMPPDLQGEVDLFDWLDRYRVTRGDFPERSALHASIDDVIRLATAGRVTRGDRAFLQLVTRVLDEPERALALFPVRSEGAEYALQALHWYSNDVEDRRLDEPEPYPQDTAKRHLLGFLLRVEKRTDRSLVGKLWNVSGILFLLAQLAAFVLPVLLAVAVAGEEISKSTEALITLGAIAWGSVLLYGYLKGPTRGWMDRIRFWFSHRCYEKLWRDDLAQFLESTRIPLGVVRELLPLLRSKHVTNHGWMAMEIDEDPGMALYSLALRFDE